MFREILTDIKNHNFSFHHNPEYFRNPETFDPERFGEENRRNINQAHFVPFGIGPRSCIGNC